MSKMLIFPGQGAQAVGMGRELAEGLPECRALFSKASEVMGFDLLKLCVEGPIEELTKSCNTQPAIFVVSVAARDGAGAFRGRAAGGGAARPASAAANGRPCTRRA